MQKYEILTDEYHKKGKLYKIRALIDFDDVCAGDIGGYIEDYSNLSQEGNCWVYYKAEVSGNARVYNNAKIYDMASICDDA